MPRKAPDKVIEHRITLGSYERAELREVVKRYKTTSVASSVGNVLQGIGWPVLAGAALLYVGFSLDDLIEDTKGFIDSTSDGVVNWVEDNGLVVYTAPKIGEEIKQTEEKKAAIYEQYVNDLNSGKYTYSSQEAKRVRKKLERLETREQTLRRMLDKIAKGEASEFSLVTFFDSGGVVAGTTQGDATVDRTLQEFYEQEGGVGEFDQ